MSIYPNNNQFKHNKIEIIFDQLVASRYCLHLHYFLPQSIRCTTGRRTENLTCKSGMQCTSFAGPASKDGGANISEMRDYVYIDETSYGSS